MKAAPKKLYRKKSVSFPKPLLARALRRAQDHGETFSGYLRRLVLQDEQAAHLPPMPPGPAHIPFAPPASPSELGEHSETSAAAPPAAKAVAASRPQRHHERNSILKSN